MAIVSTISSAVFCGFKSGQKKSGGSWLALQFKALENHNGVEIHPNQMASPNLMIFPGEGFDTAVLAPNSRYHLQVEAVGRKNSTYAQYNLLKVHPADK